MSALLLDTHTFLWWRSAPEQIPVAARDAIANTALVFVSAASAWEAAIKAALGRLVIPTSFAAGVDASGFQRMPIAFEHAEAAAALPRHHADPFDRMLIAQAMLEGCTLVSHDRAFALYGASVLWA